MAHPGSLDPARARPARTNARLPHPESTGAVAWGKAAGRHCAAVLLKPGIILADEPTASLDEANAGQVSLLLSGYARTLGSTLLVVSHDDAVLADMDRVLDLNRGIVREAA